MDTYGKKALRTKIHLPGLRTYLLKLNLMLSDGLPQTVEDQETRAGGSLIDRANKVITELRFPVHHRVYAVVSTLSFVGARLVMLAISSCLDFVGKEKDAIFSEKS